MANVVGRAASLPVQIQKSIDGQAGSSPHESAGLSVPLDSRLNEDPISRAAERVAAGLIKQFGQRTTRSINNALNEPPGLSPYEPPH
jgi:hypothetical protein